MEISTIKPSVSPGMAVGTAAAVIMCFSGMGEASAVNSKKPSAASIAQKASEAVGKSVPAIDNSKISFTPSQAKVQYGSSFFKVQGVTNSKDKQVVVREHGGGVQTMVVAATSAAAAVTNYEFSNNVSLVTAKSQGFDTGEVVVVRDGQASGVIAAPWATDSAGHRLSTHYTVSGHTLTQHVKTDANTEFPVTLDPDWLGIAKCAGAISLAAASIIVPGGIVGKLISKVGSVKKAAEILYRALKAKSYKDKLTALRNMAAGLGANLTGIGVIASNCG